MKRGWREVLDAAHQRSVLSAHMAKKFKVVNQGLWPHVEASLADRDRALKRSHQAVGAMAYLGRGAEEEIPREPGVDLECYDDSELYQHLLKEFMDNTGGSGGVTDPLMHLPIKSKRTKKVGVDRKASKGRKIRYVLHPKLEHFMFPVPLPPPPMDIDRLFASLPGASKIGAEDRPSQ